MTTDAQATRAIDQLIEFALGLEHARLPGEVERRARGLVLDTLGAMLQASSPRYAAGRILMEFARDQGGTPEATVVGGGFRTNRVQAALVNGTLGYYCDVEPHHPGAIMHGTAIVVPTALAVGEQAGAGGPEFTAVAVGLDVACRVSNAIDPTALYRRGLQAPSPAPSVQRGGTARLLRLDPARFRHALGLVGTQASGLLAWETDPTEHARPSTPALPRATG